MSEEIRECIGSIGSIGSLQTNCDHIYCYSNLIPDVRNWGEERWYTDLPWSIIL